MCLCWQHTWRTQCLRDRLRAWKMCTTVAQAIEAIVVVVKRGSTISVIVTGALAFQSIRYLFACGKNISLTVYTVPDT